MMEKTVKFIQKEQALWGPLFLLLTLASSFKSLIAFDLLLIVAIGFFLCSRWNLRGCAYSLALLGMYATVKHAFFISDHLWQLGIECSLISSFLIVALASEQISLLGASQRSQIEMKSAALLNCEDELSKTREANQAGQIAYQEKIAVTQKELEELQAEHSSILILNEVLRKTTARHIQENEKLHADIFDLQRQKNLLKAEYVECNNELSQLASTDAMIIENKELRAELNAARFQREQTHLINETLARLYMRETLKAKEASEEASHLAEELSFARRERAVDPHVVEELNHAQEKIMHLSQMEPMLRQLKEQFEDKNQVLHQARSELFKADTELQKLKMEKAALELNPIPKEVELELLNFSSQIALLEEENRELSDLIGILSENSVDAAKRKKKLKIQSPPEQELLF